MKHEWKRGLIVDSGVVEPRSVYKFEFKQHRWETKWKEKLTAALPAEHHKLLCQTISVWGAGYHAPFKALKAWGEIASSCAKLEAVPKNGFFQFLFELIVRHAVFTQREQVNRFDWRADCLKGMLRNLGRELKGEAVTTRNHIDEFVSMLIHGCRVPSTSDTDFPLIKAYYGSDPDKQSLARTAVKFAKTNAPQVDSHSPLSVKDLWDLGKYIKRSQVGTGIPESLSETALWLDLKLQLESGRRLEGEKCKLIYSRVNSFLFHMGDNNWCEEADRELNVLPWHQSLVKLGAAKNAQLATYRRRPSATARRAFKHFFALENDIFKNAAHPSVRGAQIVKDLLLLMPENQVSHTA
jgi:hypothetical protein